YFAQLPDSAVCINTSAGGTASAAPGSGGVYVLSVAANEGYELASLSVTDETGAPVQLQRLDDLGTQFAFTLPGSGMAYVDAVFQRGSDWDSVAGAADTIGAAGDRLGGAMDQAQADTDVLMDALNKLLNSQDPADVQPVLD